MYLLFNGKRINLFLPILALCFVIIAAAITPSAVSAIASNTAKEDYIKWVDFTVPYEALDKAMRLDIEYHGSQEVSVNWIELLACIGAKNGGNYKGFKTSQLDAIVEKLKSGETIQSLTKDYEYYDYYYRAYSAVLSEYLGEYEIEVKDDAAPGGKRWEKKYGLKVFSPIAKNYSYNDFDDFGNSRSYGYKRKHLGHDMMGYVGTPIIAVESGTIEEMGWNQYGGWRIGIRSLDKKRYYYYAHMRKNFPFNKTVKIGSQVKAGDVIGYLGRTGYSTTENVNNITQPHLHFGIQLIFDESQKEGNNEIWIDCYNIVKLLSRNRSETLKNDETKDYFRVYDIRESSGDS